MNFLRRYSSLYAAGIGPVGYLMLATVAIGWVFLVPQLWVFLATAGFILAIASLGLTVLVGWAKEISLVQAGLVGSTCYVSGYAFRPDGWEWPFIPAVAIGILVGVALSAVVALPTAKLSGIYIMVLTLGLQITIERTIFVSTKLSGGENGVYAPRPEIFGLSIESDKAFYFFILAILVVTIGILSLLRSSRHGRAMMLVGTDRQAAAATGVSPWRYKILAFLIAGALAGLAGALSTPFYRSPPTFFQFISFQSLFYLAIPVLAGFEMFTAVVVTAVAFSMIPHAMQSWELSPLLLGGTGLILGTAVGPRGLGGAVGDLFKRVSLSSLGQVLSRARPGRGKPSPAIVNVSAGEAAPHHFDSGLAFAKEGQDDYDAR